MIQSSTQSFNIGNMNYSVINDDISFSNQDLSITTNMEEKIITIKYSGQKYDIQIQCDEIINHNKISNHNTGNMVINNNEIVQEKMTFSQNYNKLLCIFFVGCITGYLVSIFASNRKKTI